MSDKSPQRSTSVPAKICQNKGPIRRLSSLIKQEPPVSLRPVDPNSSTNSSTRTNVPSFFSPKNRVFEPRIIIKKEKKKKKKKTRKEKVKERETKHMRNRKN
eukprot:GHVL01017486.1.p1 GENE.GHVL01017486.1~~GHVL01017486.1.p1  ORF type:complete len:114 (+),score=33.71 GHVL01017486.1:39-344(+)